MRRLQNGTYSMISAWSILFSPWCQKEKCIYKEKGCFLVICRTVIHQESLPTFFSRQCVLYNVPADRTFRYLEYLNFIIVFWNKTSKESSRCLSNAVCVLFPLNILCLHSVHVKLLQIPSTKIRCGRECSAKKITWKNHKLLWFLLRDFENNGSHCRHCYSQGHGFFYCFYHEKTLN